MGRNHHVHHDLTCVQFGRRGYTSGPVTCGMEPSRRLARKRPSLAQALLAIVLFASTALGQTSDEPVDKDANVTPNAPVISRGTGLLRQPPLSLSDFTHAQFVAAMDTVAHQAVHKAWTTPVVPLPLLSHPHETGLDHEQVMAYMTEARRLFEAGQASPVSDVGLISSQEDVVRQPMLNTIAAFSNREVRAYILVQKMRSSSEWASFSIVQDLTVRPARDYYARFKEAGPKFLGRSCYACHASGPLAIRPARPDLVSDPQLAAAISHFIAEQPRSEPFFPDTAPRPPTGSPLTLPFCARCHVEGGQRDRLYQIQSHPIRVLVDFGYMPPNRHLSPAEVSQLKAWLDHDPDETKRAGASPHSP